MLSDEEREALQYFNTETKTEAMHYGAVLVKLIEKQSKEIEELNKENTRQHELIGNIHKKWKDKIKAKMEEYEEKIKKIKEKSVWEEPYDTEKYVRYTNYISVLQSLLEKE